MSREMQIALLFAWLIIGAVTIVHAVQNEDAVLRELIKKLG